MSWKINYTKHSREDLIAIYEYIAYELLVPDTAGRQVDRILKAVRMLENMSERHKIYEEEPWKSQNLRYFPVDNYLVLAAPIRIRWQF
ncbi:MAG: type II toxin-antitoxin system RelE/ParE family toxin [Lachnospiraceae bacterium]|nr:type II toxin-antitoxin system RelE/ParE family toxin [Lachnospiraceae bacterium]